MMIRTATTCFSRKHSSAARGMTLLEVLIALFIFMVGIVGVLAALPAGINSASYVLSQDTAIHLAPTHLSEFRRDGIEPAVDLIDGSAYLPAGGSYTLGAGIQEPLNGNPGNYRDFAHGPGEPYEFFDDIKRYEWKVEINPVYASAAGNPAPPPDYMVPSHSGGTALPLTRVVVTVHTKGTAREFSFTQYMYGYGN
jgi:type II secretory pathway pseudopilin PulG